MINLFSYQLSIEQIVLLTLVALLIGMAKTGIAGAGMIAVPILAIVFGGKESTGIMLPMLITADVFAVWYYHKHANWGYLKQLLPFAIAGIVLGTVIGHAINDQTFKLTMAIIIFISLGIMIWQERQSQQLLPTSPWLTSKLFSSSIGISGGFTTMVGNLAGPVMALYLLAMRLPKNAFIGTAAWFFITVNLIKVPFHILVWETITVNSVLLNTALIPAVAAGAWLGIKLVALIPEKVFRIFVISMTAVAAVAMLL